MNEAKNPARERELDKTTALYNAATDYAAYVNSNKHDYDEAMKLSDALESAAVSYAEIAGDRQPAMPKTGEPSTLASATGYEAHVWLIQYANEDGISHLHQTIFEHEVRAMAKSALEHKAVSLTILRSQNPVPHSS